MKYKAESNFKIADSERSSLVYNLRFERARFGRSSSVNDVEIRIEGRSLGGEERMEIAKLIRDALNANYGI